MTKHRRNTIKGYSYIVTSKMYSCEVVCIHKFCGNVHELRTCIDVCSFGVYKTAACTTCMQMYFHVHKKKCKQIFNFSRLGESAPSIRFDCFISNAMRGALKKKQFFAKGLIVIPIKRPNSFLIWFRSCEPWLSHMQQKYLGFCLLPSFHQYFQHSIWIMSILLVWC